MSPLERREVKVCIGKYWAKQSCLASGWISFVTQGTRKNCLPCQTAIMGRQTQELVVHMQHALQQGIRKIEVRTVDTDVLIILVGAFHALYEIRPSADIWVAFGMGKNYRFLSMQFATAWESCMKAQLFHALTGCGTTSAFKGKGKKTTCMASLAGFSNCDRHICSSCPTSLWKADSRHFKTIERLVVLYDHWVVHWVPLMVPEEELFCRKNRSVERIPPTKDALLQHTRRAVCQAGIWTSSMQTHQAIPSPQEFSWNKLSNSWEPVWITIPEVSKACCEQIKCSCKGDCSKCTCAKANYSLFTTLQLQV